jgi:hypothetical protein
MTWFATATAAALQNAAACMNQHLREGAIRS